MLCLFAGGYQNYDDANQWTNLKLIDHGHGHNPLICIIRSLLLEYSIGILEGVMMQIKMDHAWNILHLFDVGKEQNDPTQYPIDWCMEDCDWDKRTISPCTHIVYCINLISIDGLSMLLDIVTLLIKSFFDILLDVSNIIIENHWEMNPKHWKIKKDF